MATSPFILGHEQRLARLAGLSESLGVWSDESAGGHEETGGLLGDGGVCWWVQMVIWVGGGKMWDNVIWVWSSDGSCAMERWMDDGWTDRETDRCMDEYNQKDCFFVPGRCVQLVPYHPIYLYKFVWFCLVRAKFTMNWPSHFCGPSHRRHLVCWVLALGLG